MVSVFILAILGYLAGEFLDIFRGGLFRLPRPSRDILLLEKVVYGLFSLGICYHLFEGNLGLALIASGSITFGLTLQVFYSILRL